MILFTPANNVLESKKHPGKCYASLSVPLLFELIPNLIMTLYTFIHDSVGWEGPALKYMNADMQKKMEEKHKAEKQVNKIK